MWDLRRIGLFHICSDSVCARHIERSLKPLAQHGGHQLGMGSAQKQEGGIALITTYMYQPVVPHGGRVIGISDVCPALQAPRTHHLSAPGCGLHKQNIVGDILLCEPGQLSPRQFCQPLIVCNTEPSAAGGACCLLLVPLKSEPHTGEDASATSETQAYLGCEDLTRKLSI